MTRTRTSLQRALLELAGARPLDDITIADIADRAGVNRSSFYQHYADKDSLLADALESVLDAAAAPLRATIETGAHPGIPAELGDYLRHMADNRALYRRVLGAHGSAAVSGRLRHRIQIIVEDSLAAADPTSSASTTVAPLDVVAAGIAGMVLGVMSAWVARDPLPPVEVAAGWLEQVLRTPGRLLPDAVADS